MHEQLKFLQHVVSASPDLRLPSQWKVLLPHPFDQYQFVLLWGAVSSYRVKVFFREL